MPILGSHMSISGGVHKAVERAAKVGCDCVQLFTGNPRQFQAASAHLQSGRYLTKNNNQWRATEITEELADRFKAALADLGISHPIAHDTYLINLASPDKQLWKKSIDAFVTELGRADTLGIPFVVTHPGAFTTSSESQGIKRIIKALDEVHGQTGDLGARCLLETTAGQGSTLGWRFEQLAALLDGVKDPERLGVCFDTCHVFAAGYPMATEKEYKATLLQFNRTVGVAQIKAFHLNDSRRELGSRVDRHAHIGRGEMGIEPFRHLLGDRRFRKVPMYLETPKEMEKGRDMDVVNLELLRSLAS